MPAAALDAHPLLAALGPEPLSIDRLAHETGFDAARLGAVLTLLEMKDRARDIGGGRVVGI